MQNHILIIDESGAKGYSRNTEKHPREFGVMSGFLLPEEYMDIARRHLDLKIGSVEIEGKIHITNQTPELQEKLRNVIFDFFKNESVPWIFEAVSTQGLYESEFFEGRGGSRNRKESLHSKIFMGIVIKAFAMLEKARDEGVKLTIISDNIDRGVIKQFKTEIAHFICMLKGDTIEEVSKMSVRTPEGIVKKTLITRVPPPQGIPRFKNIELDIICENSSLTFAADILANSAYYHINQKLNISPNTKLNSRQAISSHPLVSLVYMLYDESNEEYLNVNDVIFRRTLQDTPEPD